MAPAGVVDLFDVGDAGGGQEGVDTEEGFRVGSRIIDRGIKGASIGVGADVAADRSLGVGEGGGKLL